MKSGCIDAVMKEASEEGLLWKNKSGREMAQKNAIW